MPRADLRRLPSSLTFGWILVGLLALPFGGLPAAISFDNPWLYHLAAIACIGMCLTVAGSRRQRIGWTLIFCGALAWILGDLYFNWLPVPLAWSLTVADLGFIAFYPLVGAGILLLRDGPPAFAKSRWSQRARVIRVIDGTAVALAISSIAAALTMDRALQVYRLDPAGTIVNLLYPVLGSVLLCMMVVILAVHEWAAHRHWWCLSIGIVAFWLADTAFIVAGAQEGTVAIPLMDAGWLAAFACFGNAATGKVWPGARRRQLDGWRQVAVPSIFALAAFTVLLLTVFQGVNVVGSILAALTMFAVLIRQILTLIDHHLLIATVRQEARTDALTGLANRRALLDDLQEMLVTAAQSPFALVLFDLDGFKRFNDRFGHPAGDTLLVRRGRALRQTPGIERAYRLGGDEYCIIVPVDPVDPDERWREVVAGCVAALVEDGTDYHVSASWGCAVVPRDAGTISQVMQCADHRMYANKYERRAARLPAPRSAPTTGPATDPVTDPEIAPAPRR